MLGRIVAQLVNEALFAVGEGVGSPDDVDAGLELGLNHPRGPVGWGRDDRLRPRARRDRRALGGAPRGALPPGAAARRAAGRDACSDEVEQLPWYHVMELPGGVVTPGVDDPRDRLPLLAAAGRHVGPERARRRRVGRLLLVRVRAARRRARGRGGGLVRLARGGARLEAVVRARARRRSARSVEDVEIRVEELSPERVGTFDLVLFAGVLYHVRDPLRALEAVASVTKGHLMLETHVDLVLKRKPAAAFYPARELGRRPHELVGPEPGRGRGHAARGRLHGRREGVPALAQVRAGARRPAPLAAGARRVPRQAGYAAAMTTATAAQLSDSARVFVEAAPHKLLIGEEWVEAASGETFETIDPATGDVICEVAKAGAEDVDRAVKAAQAALDGPVERDAGLRARAADARSSPTWSTRTPPSSPSSRRSTTASRSRSPAPSTWRARPAHLRYYAGWPTKIEGETIPVTWPNAFVYTLKEPVGVCGQIIPWNFPLLMAAWKIAPGARRRLHGDPQAGRADAADGAPARPADPGGRASRRAS